MENFDLKILSQKIAEYLPGWIWQQHDRVYMQDSWQLLAGPDGAKIDLRYDKRHRHICIGGIYPCDGSGVYPGSDKERPADLTVSAWREPRAIAREMEKRFLPAYLAAYRKGLEQFTKAKAREQSRKDLALRLATLCGEGQHLRGFEFSHYGAKCFSFAVRVDGPDLVQVTIHSLPDQKAEEVLKVLLAPGSTPQRQGL